jgi:hypothetical protein
MSTTWQGISRAVVGDVLEGLCEALDVLEGTIPEAIPVAPSFLR